MRFAGFNLTKIKVEKLSDSFNNLKINTNILVSSMEKFSSELINEKEDVINIKFTYSIDYEPSIAKMEFGGVIAIIVDKEKSKELLNQWKDKKLPEDVQIPLFNLIIRKVGIKALQIEDEINLPLHISLPSIKPSKDRD